MINMNVIYGGILIISLLVLAFSIRSITKPKATGWPTDPYQFVIMCYKLNYSDNHILSKMRKHGFIGYNRKFIHNTIAKHKKIKH
jgi:hypothetical protein